VPILSCIFPNWLNDDLKPSILNRNSYIRDLLPCVCHYDDVEYLIKTVAFSSKFALSKFMLLISAMFSPFCIHLKIDINPFFFSATSIELPEAMTFSTIYGKKSPSLTNSTQEILIRDQQRSPLYR